MKDLKGYLKPYWGYVVIIVMLLFCQAMVDLNLPNLMSRMVNVGIQHSGIETNAPEAISTQTLEQLLGFASDEDRAAIEAAYPTADRSTMESGEWNKFVRKWPAAAQESVSYLKTDSKQENQAVEEAFSRTSYAMARLKKEQGEAQPTEEQLKNAQIAASAAPETLLTQTSAVFIQEAYRQLDADLGSIQTRYLLRVGAQMLLLTVILVSCAASNRFFGGRLGTGVARDLRRDIFARVTSFTNNEFDRFGTASLITRSTNDVMQIQGLLIMGLRVMCYAPILGIGGIIMALNKNAGMAWIIALAAIIIFGVIAILFSIALPRFKKMQKLVDKLNQVSRENLSGMMVVRAFSTQKFEEERFAKANRSLADNNLGVYRAMATMSPVMTLVLNGVSLLIVWVGGHRIAASTMQVGDMMAFIQYSAQIIRSFLMISMLFVNVTRAVVSGNRIAEVLRTESSVQDPEQPDHLPEKVKGEICFEDVAFRYEGADENVLEHISFTAKPGETTAFIGSTGSGKSTLVNLIPRFYDVAEGRITLDGVDIRKIPQKELRNVIGYVPQKGILFSGDIASNLRIGDENATDAQLHSAVETAQASEFVDRLPDGLATEISQGGTNVSGGQRQRLSIARALVKNAPVYIFDDTFSALDFKTDAKLRAALRQYTKKSAMLVVAQRVSTIMHAEQIVVLDEGRIVGIGTHKELLEHCKTYREIAQSQLSKEELA